MLLEMDIRTLIIALFWCNLTYTLLILCYNLFSQKPQNTLLFKLFFCAKLSLAASALLVLTRGTLHDFFSVNIGNSLMFTGLYFEILCALIILKAEKNFYYILTAIFAVSLVVFNLMELLNTSPNMRVSLASIFMFALLFYPGLMFILKKNVSRFKKVVGGFYILVALLLLPRAVYMITTHGDLFTNNAIQTLSFLSLIMLMVFTSSAYLLLIKEDADQTINFLATTDFLTGLPNRYSFMEHADKLLDRHKFSGELVTMLFCDIDNFKAINDKHGHLFGDLVLKELAGVIKKCLRPFDLSCRYGGEEFIILLNQGATEAGGIVAERIMKELTRLKFAQHPDFSFTVSIGVAKGIPREGQDIDTFIHCSDQALYHAKHTGKNKVVEFDVNEA